MIITRDALVGVSVAALALLLMFFLIPNYVDAPPGKTTIYLSPLFWPQVISWAMLIVGVLIVVLEVANKKTNKGDGYEMDSYDEKMGRSYWRVLNFLTFLFVYYLLINTIGMVWSSCLAFVIFSLLLSGTEHKKTAVIVGCLLPLLLYVFFNHVAGVSIPQSELMRLP